MRGGIFFVVRSDTISAIATPAGEGAIGIVRLSGKQAFAISEQMFQRPQRKPLQSHRVYYGKLVDPETGEVLDHALMLTFRAPHSYTGEDVVEFSCHGSPHLLNRVLALTWRLGARPAEPGEFTQRAFLNGKLDLAQAESVADLIRARTDAQHRTAIALHEGILSKQIRHLSERVLGVLAQVEAVIDFSEEIGELDAETLSKTLHSLQTEIQTLLETAVGGRLLREGVRTAIVGRPNVGKSSLLNRLLGEERAIVTPIAGTTRDTLEETARIGGVPFVMVDTAGLRQSNDLVEQMGIERTLRAVQTADLILLVMDASEGLTEADCEILTQLPADRPCIWVWNKVDLVNLPALTHPSPPSPTASGEGSGVRATSENLTPPPPLSASREGGEAGDSPSPFTERGSGGEVNSETPSPTLPLSAGGGSQSRSSPAASGEGSGVRATSENLTPPSPLSASREGGEAGCSPSPFTERGSGGEVNSEPPTPTLPLTQGEGAISTCYLSALTGEGLTELHAKMLQAVHLNHLQTESPLLVHQRHAEAVRRALDALQSAQASLQRGLPPDLIAVDLRSAWLALGEITGETLDTELVNRIFRDFCIGK